MTTLTLSVESFFRPELASSVPTLAAGPASKKPSAAKTQLGLEPQARDPIVSLGGFLRPSAPSTTGLLAVNMKHPVLGSCSHDDSGAALSWTGVGAGIAADSGRTLLKTQSEQSILQHPDEHPAGRSVAVRLAMQPTAASKAAAPATASKSDDGVKKLPSLRDSSCSKQAAQAAQASSKPSESDDTSAALRMPAQSRPSLAAQQTPAQSAVDPILTLDTHSPITHTNTISGSTSSRLATFTIPASNALSTPIKSTPSHTPPRQTIRSPPDTASPAIRKLKLSLKLPQLTKLQSMSQLSPKSVRFALRLEKVKMFDGTASPASVSLQGTPAGSPLYGLQNHDDDDDYFSVRHHFADLSDDDACLSSDSDTYSEFTKSRQYKIASSNFVAPHNIYDKRELPVYLQSMALSADRQLLVLTVMCQNLAFEKNLLVKLTFNDWHSLMIYTSASYCKLFSLVNFDQFRFTIPLTHLPSALTTQFCIMYNVAGATYWDNNSTHNYRLSLEQYARPHVARDLFTFKPSTVKDSFTYKPPVFSRKSTVPGVAVLAPGDPLDCVPKSESVVPHYNELVDKLMSVKNTKETPTIARLLALSPKPRYLQAYMAKRGSESNIQSMGRSSDSFADKHANTRGSAASGRPILLRSAGSVPSALPNSNIGTMSYADLLQNYCFNGAAKTPANAAGSFTSSCNSSSASLSSDFTTLASTYHSANDSFFV